MKLSKAQRRVLENLKNGRKIYDHCRSNSDWGGLAGTIDSLHRRRFLDNDGGITAAGLDALSPKTSRNETKENKPMGWIFDMDDADHDRVLILHDPHHYPDVAVGYFEDHPDNTQHWWMMTDDGGFAEAKPIAFQRMPESPKASPNCQED
jgi:hypothetical protein